jgi:putative membrane protein
MALLRSTYATSVLGRAHVCLALSAAFVALTACAGRREARADSASGDVEESRRTSIAVARSMTDENILAKAGEAAREEIQLARLASSRVRSSHVKAFAQELIEDHGRLDRAIKDLERKLDVTEAPAANDTSAEHLQHLVDRFGRLPARAFDTAFVNHAIADHEHDIAEMRAMAARAKRKEIRELLEESIPDLRHHLSRAKELRLELKRRR